MIGDCMVYLATLLVVLSVVTSSCEPAIVEHTDMVEVNHFHNIQGDPAFTQVIFWKWYHDKAEYHVRSWTMHEKLSISGKTVSFFDGQSHRKITSAHFKESWSQSDPERADKEHVAETERIRLVPRVIKPVEPMILPEVDQ
jgi:hypothetical protein